MNSSQFLIDGMVWSYSRLNTYTTCPREFKLRYLDALPSADNAFAEFGTICHEILASYYNGILPAESMGTLFASRFEGLHFPYKKLQDSYRTTGKCIFDFYVDPFSGASVIDVEQKTKTKIEGLRFIGVMDLVLEKDGLQIVDHKSHAPFKTEAEKTAYSRQLYLYALLAKARYDIYPTKLTFNHFRHGTQYDIDFSMNDMNHATEWVLRTWDKLYADTEFAATPPSDFYCKHLCSARHHCEHGGTNCAD